MTKNIRQITKEINDITLKIEEDCPELYKYLDEIPETIPNYEDPTIDEETFSNYLDGLKKLLDNYLENHQKSN